jgi:hypothetical protein
MSACSIFVKPQCVYLVTDAASYFVENSKIFAIGSKVVTLPHLGAVVASVGDPGVSLILQSTIAQSPFASFDELAAEWADVARLTDQAYRGIVGNPTTTPAHSRHYLAGFTKWGQPVACMVENQDRPDVPAYTVETMRAPQRSMSPDVPTPPGPVPDSPDVAVLFFRQFAMAQREAEPMDIGGFMQLTTVFRDHIDTRVIARWPDRIGEAQPGNVMA